MTRELEEYQALRSTVRTRGSVRVCLAVAGIAGWAVVLVLARSTGVDAGASLAALLVLAGAFEGVFALHVGVERIGRYLQVFHDDTWEATSMSFGPPLAGTGSDPLFRSIYGCAAIVNLAAATLHRHPRALLLPVGLAHLVFLARLMRAARATRRQRAADLERFRALQSRS